MSYCTVPGTRVHYCTVHAGPVLPRRGKFWPLGGCEKEEKEKEKKERKRKKKEVFFCVFGDQSNAFLSVISWTYSTIFESIENNYSPLQLETSITLYWMTHLTTIMLAILADILGCDITLSLLKISSIQRWPHGYRINLTSNSPLDFQKLIHLGIKFVSEWGFEHHLWHIHTKPDVFLGMSTYLTPSQRSSSLMSQMLRDVDSEPSWSKEVDGFAT